MRRAQAIVLIVSLLATPLALLARGAACAERSSCAKMCCRPQHSHASQESAPSEMACHHRGSAPSHLCTMESGRSGAMQFGMISPLPPTQLASGPRLQRPASAHEPVLVLSTSPASGFLIPPFEPPRS